ncbi:hypothetical protein Peur_019279 [Populus x canadensis]
MLRACCNFLQYHKKKVQQSLDLAVVFVGRGLFSTDISASKNADPALVNFLKVLLQSPIFPWDFRMLLHQRRQWRIHWFLGLLKLVDRI